MSLDTKQILHIVTELIVIVGISIYFVNKNKILSDHIEELELKIKQQEEILQNHDNLILKIMNTINVMNSQQHQQPQPQQPQPQPQIPQLLQKNKIKLPKNINSSKKVVMIIPPSPQKPVQKKPKVEEIIEEEDEDEEDECDNEFKEEDLDEELLEELKDLEEGLEEDI